MCSCATLQHRANIYLQHPLAAPEEMASVTVFRTPSSAISLPASGLLRQRSKHCAQIQEPRGAGWQQWLEWHCALSSAPLFSVRESCPGCRPCNPTTFCCRKVGLLVASAIFLFMRRVINDHLCTAPVDNERLLTIVIRERKLIDIRDS